MKKLNQHADKLRFLIVGASMTVLDFALMNLGVFAGLNQVPANLISTIVAMFCSFLLNKKYTFKSDGKTKKQITREILAFFVFTIIGLWVIQTGIIWSVHQFVPNFLNNQFLFDNFAKCFATIFSMTWNYFAYKHVVFKKANQIEKQ
ncbi:GtrA family protein [Candidatus Saccharibacteria bacterium]|nr:GtrA family protein [Candidatus Saccharibacteria bacterium]